MSSFSLENGLLGKAGNRFGDLSDDTKKANGYTDDNVGSVRQSDGRIFAIALRDHAQVVAKINENIDRSRKLLTGVSGNLTTADTRYNTTEHDNTVKVNDIFGELDSTGASHDHPPTLPDHSGGGTAMGTAFASAKLTPAQDMQGIPEWVAVIVGFGGSLISPSYWLEQIFSWTIGVNPVQWLTDQMAGEWGDISKAGDAVSHLGDYWDQFSSLIGADAEALFTGWTGDAAQSAQPYFAELMQAFGDMSGPLQSVAKEYEQLAWGCYLTSTALVTGINLLLDVALIAAINAAIVATTAWFNPEAAVSLALLMACLEIITADWMTMLTVIAGTEAAAFAFAGAMAAFFSSPGSVDQLQMPQEA